MSALALDAIVGRYFEGAQKAIVLNSVVSAATQGLGGRALFNALRSQGIRAANAKFNDIWKHAQAYYGATSKIPSAAADEVLGYPYTRMGYASQNYNYIYQTEVRATFHEIPGIQKYHISVTSSRPLTKAEIYDQVLTDLQQRNYAPTSDYGSLRTLYGTTIQTALQSPDSFMQDRLSSGLLE